MRKAICSARLLQGAATSPLQHCKDLRKSAPLGQKSALCIKRGVLKFIHRSSTRCLANAVNKCLCVRQPPWFSLPVRLRINPTVKCQNTRVEDKPSIENICVRQVPKQTYRIGSLLVDMKTSLESTSFMKILQRKLKNIFCQ